MSDLAIRARKAVDEANATVLTLDRVNVALAIACGAFLGILSAAFI